MSIRRESDEATKGKGQRVERPWRGRKLFSLYFLICQNNNIEREEMLNGEKLFIAPLFYKG